MRKPSTETCLHLSENTTTLTHSHSQTTIQSDNNTVREIKCKSVSFTDYTALGAYKLHSDTGGDHIACRLYTYNWSV